MMAFLAAALLAGAAEPSAAKASAWRGLDIDNTLVIETTAGRIVVEMRPDLAPRAVERIKRLSREKLYDGLLFHRVIDHFVDQTGNPNNRDGGTSGHPDLAPEFDARLPPERIVVSSRPSGAVTGFVGALPVAASAAKGADGLVRTWGLYCEGVAGMGRQAAWGSANSEIFFMRDAARRLDHDYTVWGRTVSGLEVVRRIAVGVPPAHPDRMLSVRVAGDLPPTARPKIEVMNERSPAFARLIRYVRQRRGADFSPCEIHIPSRGR